MSDEIYKFSLIITIFYLKIHNSILALLDSERSEEASSFTKMIFFYYLFYLLFRIHNFDQKNYSDFYK